ncbi:MAG: helix-turn-helix domain-containing protein [Bacteroidota bacterium]
MNNRIALVLKTKNISPSQLADDLGVQRSGISHIVNGRNKPSLEFIQKLIKLYPDISMHWILFGEGPMMNPYPGQASENTSSKTVNSFPEDKPKPRIMELFNMDDEGSMLSAIPEEVKIAGDPPQAAVITEEINFEALPEKEGRKNENLEQEQGSSFEPALVQQQSSRVEKRKPETSVQENENKKPEQPLAAVRRISKILIFYNDRTFVEYAPGDE